MSSSFMPIDLSLNQGLLEIVWNDGLRTQYTPALLREKCPCATCRGKREEPQPALPVLSLEETQPVQVTGMKPLGNYAYGISFSDGHSTGIYSLELLRDLGTAAVE